MTNRPWTLLKSHPKAELWRQDRLDPGGNPVTLYRGSTFLKLPGGERRKTPEDPAFGTLAEGEAWFAAVTGAAGS
jgi:hypothetical protein